MAKTIERLKAELKAEKSLERKVGFSPAVGIKIKKLQTQIKKKKNAFEIKEVHDHMQCGCRKITKVKDSPNNTVKSQRCECTITDGSKYATNKKGGKTWKFGGIAMGQDSSL